MQIGNSAFTRHTESSPPKVTYSLSEAGQELIAPMSILCGWGTRHLGIPANLPRYPTLGEAKSGSAGVAG